MEIQERVVGNVTILDLNGKLVIGDGEKLLRDKVNSVVHQGRTLLLLNLEAVPFVDSTGLGEIARTQTTLSRQGGRLKLLHVNKRIHGLLSITKLLGIFEVFENESEAVRSFS